MSYVNAVSRQYLFDRLPFILGTVGLIDAGSAGTGSEKVAMFGYWQVDGRATGKTLDTTGSSSIGFSAGTNVFANASSIVRFGIQGISSSGPIAQPDGSWGAYSEITTAAQTTPVLASDDQWIVAVPTTGTSTISHGSAGCVVMEFYTKAGSDAINVNTINPTGGGGTAMLPTTNTFVGTPAWQTSVTLGAGQVPNVIVTCSDGTVATFQGCYYVGTPAATTWASGGTPDERGNIFTVPYDCKVDGIRCAVRTVDGTSDFTVGIYATAESGRSTVVSVAVDAAQIGPGGGEGPFTVNFTPVSLTKDTEYCVALAATGAGNVRWNTLTLGAAGHRAVFPGSKNSSNTLTLRSVTATDGGNFGSSSTTVIFPIDVLISEDTTTAGSGGNANIFRGSVIA